MSVTRDEIIAAFPLERELEKDGVKLIGSGDNRMALCAFHKEKTPSMSISIKKGTWYCFGCQKGGSVIDYLSLKQGRSIADILKELGFKLAKYGDTTPKKEEATATYIYRDETGADVFRVLRYERPGEKKTFRQQRKTDTGWEWGMEGVTRVLFRLPEILAAKNAPVAICEGEKDALTLVRLGYNATTNVGGAGKWVAAYSESLLGRDIILFGDNDPAGKAHVKQVMELLDGKVKSIRQVTIPTPYKDVTEYMATFTDFAVGTSALEDLVNKAPILVEGATVPILSMVEMEERYLETLKSPTGRRYSFDAWLPTFGERLRPCVPGDVITWVAESAAGKTCILQNMALWAAPTPTLFFELELSDYVTFERFVAVACRLTQSDVEETYKAGYTPRWREAERLKSIYVCPMSGLSVPQIERIIDRSEIKMGVRPLLVMVDYAQLVMGQGKSRYEAMTDVMVALKVMAKNTGTVVVVSSQVNRGVTKEKKKDEKNRGITLTDAKDSGQIENSSSLLIGAWQDEEGYLRMRVNKNTRGITGLEIRCNFDKPRMTITEFGSDRPDAAQYTAPANEDREPF